MISKLKSARLKEILNFNKNGVLKLLVKKGTPEHLSWVLFKLEPADQKKILDGNALDCYCLADALKQLNFSDLNALFETAENGVLKYLKKTLNTWPPCFLSSNLMI
jgi:hypothetical protein